MWKNFVDKTDRGQEKWDDSYQVQIRGRAGHWPNSLLRASKSPSPDNSFWSQASAPSWEDSVWIKRWQTRALRFIIWRISSEHTLPDRSNGIQRRKRCCSYPHSLLNKTFRGERSIWPRLSKYSAILSVEHRGPPSKSWWSFREGIEKTEVIQEIFKRWRLIRYRTLIHEFEGS